ncbi:MAG: hypothetical protein WCD69_10655 [Xanthobacteraceae bacterium]
MTEIAKESIGPAASGYRYTRADHRRSEARRFVLRLVIVVGVPILQAMAAGEIVFWRLADGFIPDAIARRLHDRPDEAWIGSEALYPAIKVAGAQLARPDVLALGASREGQFRSAMFKPYSFYNAGMAYWSFARLLDMLKLISARRQPRVIIVSIDYLNFQNREVERRDAMEAGTLLQCPARCANWDALNWLPYVLKIHPLDTAMSVGKQMIGLPAGEFDAFKLFGLTTVPDENAFLHDGSMHYLADYIANAPAPVTSALLHALAEFDKSDQLNAGQLGQLRDLAQYARRHGIAVIGVQLPFDLRRLELSRPTGDNTGNPDSIWRIFERSETRDLIESMGITFVDLTGLPEAANSQAFVDAFHPGEYLVLASLIAMLKDPRIGKLLPDIDLGALEKRKIVAESARNYFNVYGHEF